MASGTQPKYASGEDTGWIDIITTTIIPASTGNFKYRKIGNLVSITLQNCNLSNDINSGTFQVVGNLPGILIPEYPAHIVVMTDTQYTVDLLIHSNGSFRLYNFSGVAIRTTNTLNGYGTYMV